MPISRKKQRVAEGKEQRVVEGCRQLISLKRILVTITTLSPSTFLQSVRLVCINPFKNVTSLPLYIILFSLQPLKPSPFYEFFFPSCSECILYMAAICGTQTYCDHCKASPDGWLNSITTIHIAQTLNMKKWKCSCMNFREEVLVRHISWRRHIQIYCLVCMQFLIYNLALKMPTHITSGKISRPGRKKPSTLCTPQVLSQLQGRWDGAAVDGIGHCHALPSILRNKGNAATR